jgi:hypothetical protein
MMGGGQGQVISLAFQEVKTVIVLFLCTTFHRNHSCYTQDVIV